MVAHILGAVFDPKTLILGFPGVTFAPLGQFWLPWASQGTPKVAQYEKGRCLGVSSPPKWVPILAQFRIQITKSRPQKLFLLGPVANTQFLKKTSEKRLT